MEIGTSTLLAKQTKLEIAVGWRSTTFQGDWASLRTIATGISPFQCCDPQSRTAQATLGRKGPFEFNNPEL